MSIEKPLYVIGVVASAKTRFKNNRQNVTVTIAKTQLNMTYWGEGAARNEVGKELNRQGFNGFYRIVEWIYG